MSTRTSPKQQAIEGYAKGYSGPTIRRWLQEQYPDIRFTGSNVAPACPRCGVELNVKDWINGIHTAGCGQQIPLSVY